MEIMGWEEEFLIDYLEVTMIIRMLMLWDLESGLLLYCSNLSKTFKRAHKLVVFFNNYSFFVSIKCYLYPIYFIFKTNILLAE